MRVSTSGECGQCHRSARLDVDYPNGRCSRCQPVGFLPSPESRPLPRPSVQYIDVPPTPACGALMREAHVDVLGYDDQTVWLRIRHWAKKPYRVTRAEGT